MYKNLGFLSAIHRPQRRWRWNARWRASPKRIPCKRATTRKPVWNIPEHLCQTIRTDQLKAGGPLRAFPYAHNKHDGVQDNSPSLNTGEPQYDERAILVCRHCKGSGNLLKDGVFASAIFLRSAQSRPISGHEPGKWRTPSISPGFAFLAAINNQSRRSEMQTKDGRCA